MGGRLTVGVGDGTSMQFSTGPVTFGRTGELPLRGESMPRKVGTFVTMGGYWHVRNRDEGEGSSPVRNLWVTYDDDGSTLRALKVGPSGLVALPRFGTIAFTYGPPGRSSQVEISFRVDGDLGAQSRPVSSQGQRTTFDPITSRQRDVLVAFAEPELRGAPSASRRSRQEVADLWGISLRTVEDHLTAAAQKLELPSPGNRGQIEVLVRTVVEHHIVTRGDLEWADLDGPCARTSSKNPSRRNQSG